MTSEEFSQHLNGVGVMINGVFLLWAILFLWREARRREMRVSDLFCALPPSMSFTAAVLVFDAGVWIRAMVIWMWRRLGSGPFTSIEICVLEFGALLVAVGGLAKIRAVTKPDWGNLPWLTCLALATALFLLI